MKITLALAFCLGLALTQIAGADEKDKNKHAKKQATKEAAVTQHNVAQAPKQKAQVQRNVQVQQPAKAPRFHQQIQRQRTEAALNADVAAKKANRIRANTVVSNQNTRVVRNTNVVIRNRNSWYDARRFNWRTRHDRVWWVNNYPRTRFVLFGGGYYFWHNNYWYPAYGYNPGYSSYIYDEPIYGYNQYEPGQVISNVQIELQRAGYYPGPIDGLIGPMTRSALARYQADHGLYVTRAIDEPTLQSLGLV
jgi:hypothetical protein